MTQRKIGTTSLVFMMTGGVLGSGVIILPPLALQSAGPWALVGWALIAGFGLAFAYVFAHVGTLFPGEGGAANSVERAFGPAAKRLAAFTLSGAALFGPAAVMLTIADYLPPQLRPSSPAGAYAAAGVIQAVCALLLASGLRNVGRAATILASAATILLLAGSTATLVLRSGPAAPLPPFDAGAMGYTLLLLFWGVVGWEVVGNYGAEVRDPRRTVPRAAVLAAVAIAVVFMAVASAMQFGVFPAGTAPGVGALLAPLFGDASSLVMSGIVTALCVTTYLVVVGGVVRLAAHLAQEGALPRVLDRRNGSGVPWVAVAGYTVVHLFQIFLVSRRVLDLAVIVAVADGFFLTNALLGTLAAARLFTRPLPRAVAGGLSLGLAVILSRSNWQVLAAIPVMGMFSLWQVRRGTGSAPALDIATVSIKDS
ncbi:amino acid permease [Pseudodesulfovibrio sp.]|uniref:APC family permease n=1 Tax=Pseudodesulfovibrio sp. TaxID=2035812 RepID=UPI00262AB448|nr:amino acid permease [Pseudodesulfovibrio sp.]MDD3313456.1 amino acid permease [Pseudodesulfovibrio sp.]